MKAQRNSTCISVFGLHGVIIINQCSDPSGRLEDRLVFDILQEKLNSRLCRNQGFVLDGFPKTYEQAKDIFKGKFHLITVYSWIYILLTCVMFFYCLDEDTENQGSMVKTPAYNSKITPSQLNTSLQTNKSWLLGSNPSY